MMFFFFKQKTAYEMLRSLVGSEMCIRDSCEGVRRAVDLCAAPGSWSQVLSARLHGSTGNKAPTSTTSPAEEDTDADVRIVAVDLQEMAPIPGVDILQGDITTIETSSEVIRRLGNAKADIVVCDGAPDVTGLHELDEYVQHQLLLAALNITTFVLREGGDFVAKMFRGPNTPFLCAKSEIFFREVSVVKPKSSRTASMEHFIVCRGFKTPVGFTPRMIDPCYPKFDFTQMTQRDKSIATFLACGDLSGLDSDLCYDREGESLKPSHPPTQAPYLDAVENRKQVAPKRTRSPPVGDRNDY
eukprot:TRINITY_DN25153_c0_g1_i1.p1 TRINITY_DN25153_c0_g1~~TRINITY_DN25153_c0_g1_i1.p1  ORF type:complete len:300 (-),score=71.78 TRINITY_DN25153_c0_g1_i1:238-1137(-)